MNPIVPHSRTNWYALTLRPSRSAARSTEKYKASVNGKVGTNASV